MTPFPRALVLAAGLLSCGAPPAVPAPPVPAPHRDPGADAARGRAEASERRRAGREREARGLVDPALARAEQEEGEPARVELHDGLEGDARAIAWTPGDALLVAHGDFVSILDVAAGRETARLDLAGVDAISPDGRWLARLSKVPELYEIARRAPGASLELPGDAPTLHAPAFSADGRLLAVGYSVATSPRAEKSGVLVWESATGKLVATLADGADGSTAVAFSPSGALVASGDRGGNVTVWEMATKKRLLDVAAWTRADLRALRPDATQLLDRAVEGLAFFPGEGAIGAVWEGELHVSPIPHRGKGAAAPASRGVLLTSGWRNRYPLIDLSTRTRAEDPALSYQAQVAPSLLGDRFAVAEERELRIVGPGAPARPLLMRLRWRTPGELAFSDDGAELWSLGLRPGRAWPSGRELPPLKAVEWEARRRDGNERGGFVADGGRVVRKGTTVVVASCAASVRALASSPDGRLLAVGCGDGQAGETRLYDGRAPGKLLATIRELDATPVVYVTTPDGRFEILGDDATLTRQLVCRVGHRLFPLAACAERLRAPGLLLRVLRGAEPHR